jgi:hypothetical protein
MRQNIASLNQVMDNNSGCGAAKRGRSGGRHSLLYTTADLQRKRAAPIRLSAAIEDGF